MSNAHNGLYEFDKFRLDVSERILWSEAERVPLPEKAFDTLCALVRLGNRLVSKDELLTEVWVDAIVEENNVDKNISILRQVLGERTDKGKFIETVRGHGFRFVAEVKEYSKCEVQSEHSEISDPKSHIQDLLSKDQKQKNPNQSRKIYAFIALILLLGVSTAFYLWRDTNDSESISSITTVAVLPFKPLVMENRDEVLEIGMADTLIARLGGNRELVVRPLSSVRKYGNLEQDAQTAGRELGVDSVLDGNIQRWADKIRVNVRLVKVADGTLLWTGTFDEKFTDIFVVQDAISIKVLSALALRLSGDGQTQLERHYTSNAEAYEFYLRGRFHFFKVTPPEVRKAIGFYQKAIEADPNYAIAIAGLADAYRTQAIAAHAPSKEACMQAKALAMRALEIDESLADAHVVLGWLGFLCDWDQENAERQLKRAIELAPNNSEAHRAYAHLLSTAGRHDEALAESKIALELAPLTLITATLDGYFLLYAGRYEEAIVRLEKTLELDPNFWAAHNALGRVFIVQGRYDEAIAAITKARELSGGSTEPITQLGYALAKSGKSDRARATLEELKSLTAENYVPMYFLAVIYNGLDEKEEALKYLEKSFLGREAQLTFLKTDTRWENLRKDPHYNNLINRMKL